MERRTFLRSLLAGTVAAAFGIAPRQVKEGTTLRTSSVIRSMGDMTITTNDGDFITLKWCDGVWSTPPAAWTSHQARVLRRKP